MLGCSSKKYGGFHEISQHLDWRSSKKEKIHAVPLGRATHIQCSGGPRPSSLKCLAHVTCMARQGPSCMEQGSAKRAGPCAFSIQMDFSITIDTLCTVHIAYIAPNVSSRPCVLCTLHTLLPMSLPDFYNDAFLLSIRFTLLAKTS